MANPSTAFPRPKPASAYATTRSPFDREIKCVRLHFIMAVAFVLMLAAFSAFALIALPDAWEADPTERGPHNAAHYLDKTGVCPVCDWGLPG